MGVMLREGLRRLCADGGWSYAVLWRPAEAAGVRHLVWDEGHCEVTRRSTVSCSNQVKFQDDGGVGDAFEKMKSEVHVVGYGLIGCAALTGNHRWINCNLLGGESVGFVEINSQLYSGIQTVAIIPVLPQGVVQLGSIHMIMEDIGFVDRVRSLVLQLGSLAGELIFDNTVSGSLQNDHTSMEQLLGEGASHGSTGAPILTCTSQPSSSSVSEISQSRMLSHGKTPLRSNTTITTSLNPIVEFQQLKVLPSFFPLISSSGQQQIQFNENCVVSSDLCMPSKRQSVQPDVTSDDKFMLPSDGSGFSYGFSFLEQLSSSVSDGPTTSRANLAQSVPMHLDSHKCAAVSYSQGSIMMPPVSTWELHGSACDSGRHVLDTASQQIKAVRDLKDPNIFSRISYDANYVACKNTMAENPSSQATSSIDFCTTVDVLRDRKLQDVAVKIACSSSQVQLSTTCSQGFSMDGSNLNFVIREQLGGSSSQNIPCFSADQRQCTHSAPSVSVMAESSPEMLNIRTSGNDLLDVLGLYDRPAVSDSSLDCIFSNVQSVNAWESCPHVSGCMSQLDASTPFDVSVCETSSQTFTESRQDQLLDAVVSKVNMGVQDTSVDVACRTAQSRVVDYSVHLSTSKYGKLTLPGQCQSEMYAISPSLLETGVPCSSVKSSCSMAGMGDYYSGEGHKTHVNLWADSDQIAKSDDGSFAQFKKAEEMGKLNRKRSKPGENPRPRPKDRQMIQDRVKELREIVPNGAKLSIDALLERTIKHMLFLQSVTKHADKLKELGEPKIINKEGGLLLKDNFEGGATWAFEVGSQTMICPIIVEDLNPPRQLLVEMLCEERGFFLEIADLIRGLGLTILKGVMEARSDKVWARFAVEANRDVTRMDIFLSLVQLLEPRAAADAHQQGFESTNLATNTSSSQVPPGASKPL